MAKTFKEPEVLPALDNTSFHNEQFTPVTVDDSDRTVTIQDLKVLNGALECSLQAYKAAKSLGGLILLNNCVQDLIKTRRGVMKLPYGPKTAKPTGRTIEVLD